MKPISKIFSKIQTDINDMAGIRVMLAEYVDAAQQVTDDLTQELKLWIKYMTYIPSPSTNPLITPTNVLVIPASDNAVDLQRVVRNGKEGREYSTQAVGSQGIGNHAFSSNSVELNPENFYTIRLDDESMCLVFTTVFEVDEVIYVEFMSGKPYNFITWDKKDLQGNPAVILPDFICNVVEYGIKMRIFERLYNSGDDKMLLRFQNAERMFKQHLGKAKAYTKNFHDERSGVERQADKWLSDGQTMLRRGWYI